jgi:hypothetical protein
MAELHQSINDPVILSDIINGTAIPSTSIIPILIFPSDNTVSPISPKHRRISVTSTVSKDSNEMRNNEMPNNVIDNIYKSMSKIIEALTTDNLILSQQIKKIRTELEFVCNTVATMKIDNQDLISAYTNEINSIMEQMQKLTERNNDNDIIIELSNTQLLIKKISQEMELMKNKNDSIGDLQKQILDTRTMLIQLINTNMQNIKKEIIDVKKIKDDVRTYFKDDVRTHVKNIVVEEVKEYVRGMPTIDKKFEILEKEQRALLSQHIRKSTIQRVGSLQLDTSNLISMIKTQVSEINDKSDIEQIKKQQAEFMARIEQLVGNMKDKIDKL